MTLSLVFLARSSTFLTLCRSLGLPSPVLPPANSSCLRFPGLPAPSLPSWGPLSLPGPLPALQLEMLWEVSWASQGLPLHHMIPSVLKAMFSVFVWYLRVFFAFFFFWQEGKFGCSVLSICLSHECAYDVLRTWCRTWHIGSSQ